MKIRFGLVGLCAASLMVLAACEQEASETAPPENPEATEAPAEAAPEAAMESAEVMDEEGTEGAVPEMAEPQPSAEADSSADVANEVRTALTHAGAAGGAQDLAMVKMHLQHIINCLVGPSGELYDASAGDPCTGQGTGILNDLPADSESHAAATLALDAATKGKAAAGLVTAQELATKAIEHLSDAEASL